jgi:hypothetical protein
MFPLLLFYPLHRIPTSGNHSYSCFTYFRNTVASTDIFQTPHSSWDIPTQCTVHLQYIIARILQVLHSSG